MDSTRGSEPAARPGVQEARGPQMPALAAYVALAEGVYYVLTGLWSLVSIRTFQMVTGPKVDTWLVKTVGVLVAVIGAVLMVAGLRRTGGPEVPLLGVGSAIGLTAIDTIYVAKRRIWPVYLLDALAELALVAAWFMAWRRGTRREE